MKNKRHWLRAPIILLGMFPHNWWSQYYTHNTQVYCYLQTKSQTFSRSSPNPNRRSHFASKISDLYSVGDPFSTQSDHPLAHMMWLSVPSCVIFPHVDVRPLVALLCNTFVSGSSERASLSARGQVWLDGAVWRSLGVLQPPKHRLWRH